MIEEKANMGLFVTTGVFAKTAIEYARKNSIELIDIKKLILLMKEAFPLDYQNHVKVMCLECGDVIKVLLSFNEVTEIKCINGHIVPLKIENYFSPHSISTKIKYCIFCGKEMELINGHKSKLWDVKLIQHVVTLRNINITLSVTFG